MKLMEVEAYIFGPERAGAYDQEKEDLKVVLTSYKLWLSRVASLECISSI